MPIKQWITEYLVRRLKALNPEALNREELGRVWDAVMSSVVEGMLTEMAGSALDSFGVGDLVSMAMHDFDNERGVPVVSQADPGGAPGEFHWFAYGDKQLGAGAADAKGATTFQMASRAVQASRAELDLARDLGRTTAATYISPHLLEKEGVAAVNALAPPTALRFVPREDVARTRPGNSGDMSDGPLGDWRWGKFSAQLRAAFESSVREEVVDKIRAAAAGVPEPKEILDGLVKIHARQAVVDLAGQIDRAPLTTFEGLFGPASS